MRIMPFSGSPDLRFFGCFSALRSLFDRLLCCEDFSPCPARLSNEMVG
jgi:hypothetical protein